MIKLEKDKNGIVNINNLNVNLDCLSDVDAKYKFVKDNQIYYFKASSEKEAFREVFACEFADKLNIEHANYDIASIDDHFGVISESIYGIDEEFIPLCDISDKLNIKKGYANTVETMQKKILPRLCFLNRKEELIKYIRMFVFDILLANDDRHEGNTGFIYKGSKYRLAPLFDNGNIVSDLCLRNQIYCQGISNDLFDDENNYVIIEFLSSKYAKYLVEELEKLSINDLLSLVNEINEKYEYKFDIRYEQQMVEQLGENLNKLNDLKNKYYIKRG